MRNLTEDEKCDTDFMLVMWIADDDDDFVAINDLAWHQLKALANSMTPLAVASSLVVKATNGLAEEWPLELWRSV